MMYRRRRTVAKVLHAEPLPVPPGLGDWGGCMGDKRFVLIGYRFGGLCEVIEGLEG